jgi:hypothetical protein
LFTMTRDTLETTLSASANAALTPPESSSFELAREFDALSPLDASAVDISSADRSFARLVDDPVARARARSSVTPTRGGARGNE